MRGIVAATVVSLVALVGQAQAQDWITPESCAVTAADLVAAEMPPDLGLRLAEAADAVPNARGRLWRIIAKDGKVSHLWGTYHTPHPLILDLPPEFRLVLGAARVVALEFDPIPESRAEAKANADSGWMWLPEGRTDWGFVPPQVMAWIRTRLKAIGWGTGPLDHLSVAGLASLLLTDPCGDYVSGVLPGQDGYIAELAYLGGAEVTGLQQWADFGIQMTATERTAEAQAVVVLYGSQMGPYDFMEGSGRAMAFRLYLEGRTAEMDLWSEAALADVLGEADAAQVTARAEGYLLVERNVIFVARAMPLIEAGGAVIAVGAGHLAGETGPVEMLRAEGLVVERVPLPGEAP
ncbi:MAG: TraB/GumN family protein [Paracoccaceae bacterium]